VVSEDKRSHLMSPLQKVKNGFADRSALSAHQRLFGASCLTRSTCPPISSGENGVWQRTSLAGSKTWFSANEGAPVHNDDADSTSRAFNALLSASTFTLANV